MTTTVKDRADWCLLPKAMLSLGLIGILVSGHTAVAVSQDDVIPHAQSKPPNKPRTAEEALEYMEVPEGFSVEIVAAEPDLINPIAMAFDEQGRIWITESIEYPRMSAGEGRDRVKVLEDTDGDGRIDKTTIFADGLNIPCGVAIGHGGVWVSNSPDILFLQDTDGDLKADKREVIVTGFGRADTHELPNSLVWGPDGYLYGLNGVFNYSHVKQGDREYKFTCAMFRIDPRTRRFELFAEGTSNPWGIAWNSEGEAFLSACVIDHLWHISESGYYHRQAGPYPPFTWKIESIVNHKHQKAAYCGIEYFDSDAYPAEYRDRLYMGNIHGNCINVDSLERNGSTYHGSGQPDFLSANDAWFMPVSQKTGPDGSLYVLDWYDRYHCYQDARRDPEGIDRLKGRLYRIRYRDTPRAGSFNLAEETTEQLIERLASPNVFFRATAQRILAERSDQQARMKLEQLVLGADTPRKQRLHALWALMSGTPLSDEFLGELLTSERSRLRAWGVRAAGNRGEVTSQIRDHIVSLADDEDPDVRLQVAIAATKIKELPALQLLLKVLAQSADDPLIPRIVWQNLHPLLETQNAEFVALLSDEFDGAPGLDQILSRSVERILAVGNVDAEVVASLVSELAGGDANAQRQAKSCLDLLAAKVQSGELAGDQLSVLRDSLKSAIAGIFDHNDNADLTLAAALLAASWGDATAAENARKVFLDSSAGEATRLRALDAMIAAKLPGIADNLADFMGDRTANSMQMRGQVLNALSRQDDPSIGLAVLDLYDDLEAELKPKAIELLTSRLEWSLQLLDRIGDKKIPTSAVNVNQVRKLLARDTPELNEAVRKFWGTIRTDRNPDREDVIARMKQLIQSTEGDPHNGQAVFRKVCGQCHKIYGEGYDIGPDVTVNGRGSFDQLLSNVFDPSLVIGADYQARTVITLDGRVETGLLAEDNERRVVLKPQGAEQIIIARDDIEEIQISSLSLMPEDVETQLKPQEIVDLFAFLTLDRHPSDTEARLIPGTRPIEPRETTSPDEYQELIDEVIPGFATARSGVDGVGLLADHRGRYGILRTHPVDRNRACVLKGEFEVPEAPNPRLALSVSFDPAENDGRTADWRLQVKVNGKVALDKVVGAESTTDGWADFSIDLSDYAGQKATIELLNLPTGWFYEFAYWGRAEIVAGE